MTEARVVKFCNFYMLYNISSVSLGMTKLLPNGCGQGNVIYILNSGAPCIHLELVKSLGADVPILFPALVLFNLISVSDYFCSDILLQKIILFQLLFSSREINFSVISMSLLDRTIILLTVQFQFSNRPTFAYNFTSQL